MEFPIYNSNIIHYKLEFPVYRNINHNLVGFPIYSYITN